MTDVEFANGFSDEYLTMSYRKQYGPNIFLSEPYLDACARAFAIACLSKDIPDDSAELVLDELDECERLLEAHPAFTLPRNLLFAKLSQATCRLVAGDAVGSGFFADFPGDYIVTCAHVVDGMDEVRVERFIMPHIVEYFNAKIVALDYSTDLAILSYDGSQLAQPPPQRLALGNPPQPGDEIIISGFPLGCNEMRFSRGMVSGYETIDLHGAPFYGPVIDANVNPGNSGGPICDANGQVVGIAAAIPKPYMLEIDAGTYQVKDVTNANAGIGFSLDPSVVKTLCEVSLSAQKNISREFNQYSPQPFKLSRARLAQLQAETRGYYEYIENSSPIGVFSFNEDGKLFLGWSTDDNRIPLGSHGLKPLLEQISHTGGSFMLRGRHVLLYRKKYRGFISPIYLELED